MVIVQWAIKTDRGPFRKFSNADAQELVLFDCIETLYGFKFLQKERNESAQYPLTNSLFRQLGISCYKTFTALNFRNILSSQNGHLS